MDHPLVILIIRTGEEKRAAGFIVGNEICEFPGKLEEGSSASLSINKLIANEQGKIMG